MGSKKTRGENGKSLHDLPRDISLDCNQHRIDGAQKIRYFTPYFIFLPISLEPLPIRQGFISVRGDMDSNNQILLRPCNSSHLKDQCGKCIKFNVLYDTPLQYSCLEDPMGGGAWKAAVHGVAKSQTQLSTHASCLLVFSQDYTQFILRNEIENTRHKH